ncbi:MAG TPA: SufE family protein [Candidatus Poseidoniales archaeon]|jgi:cysteine desulfuration protein SufE|nr:MAG: cysteine desulfuration protein SufE [Euryarchaeota archaeon]HIG33606.1 SufE family protein [Candidatus Poseidoniales archaeon]HIL67338.1 SufE family protein [Candidatus Poseidoniales archaeon]
MTESRNWPEKLDPIVEEFSACFDSMERYELLFQYAKRNSSPLLPEEWNEQNQVHGCQSRAHVSCSLDVEGNFIMRGGADAQIVQGLMAITSIAVNGMAPSYVSEMSPDFAEEMGIRSSLTPSRANGFLNMFKRVQEEAAILSGGD